MRQHIRKLLCSVLLIAVVLTSTTAFAGAAETNLPAGMLIGDQDGLRVNSAGEYFIEVDPIEAGDVITKRLLISNMEPYAYRLSMTAEPLEETGPLKLLDEVRCTIKIDGKVLYDGRVRGDDGINMISNALDLGTHQGGMQKTMDITLKVNTDMQKYHWTTSEAIFKWNFFAVQDTDSSNVKTGQIVDNALLYLLLGSLMAIEVLLFVKKQHEVEREERLAGNTWKPGSVG